MLRNECQDAGRQSMLEATYPFHTYDEFAVDGLELLVPMVNASMAPRGFVSNSSWRRNQYSAWSLPSCPEEFAEGSVGGPCAVPA